VTDLLTLFIVLVRFEAELCNAVDARLRTECALPLSGFGTLRVIARHRACRVRDIAEQLALTVGATSKRVDRLEAAALCRRRAHPADRRSSIIELTTAGQRLLASADAVFEDELRAQLGRP
jgi:DNA-binding MarR family transcriptional regulator